MMSPLISDIQGNEVVVAKGNSSPFDLLKILLTAGISEAADTLSNRAFPARSTTAVREW